MKKYERYIERDDLKDATHLEVSVYYSKGGTNFFSGGVIPRGYFLSVQPVKKGNGMVSFNAFSGQSLLLLETKRYTDKQFARAKEMAKEREEELIAVVISENKAA